MTCTNSLAAIVVGIDGSETAIRAAQWAANEAVSRDLCLRLVHVIEPGSEAVRLENEYAEISLTAACSAVETISRKISVESTIKRGGIDAVLADESRHAVMMCIGSSATNGLEARRCGGSTTAALVRSAQCPLAVIGVHQGPDDGDGGWIAVIVGGLKQNDSILWEALNEARLRKLPLLVLDVGAPPLADPGCESAGRLARWQLSHPEVVTQCVAARTDVFGFLSDIRRSIAMTIVDATQLLGQPRLMDPSSGSSEHGRPHVGLWLRPTREDPAAGGHVPPLGLGSVVLEATSS